MQASPEQTVSSEELERLTHRALVAVEWRALWRMLPFREIATEEPVDLYVQALFAAGEGYEGGIWSGVARHRSTSVLDKVAVIRSLTELAEKSEFDFRVCVSRDISYLLGYAESIGKSDWEVPDDFFLRPLWKIGGRGLPGEFEKPVHVWASLLPESLKWMGDFYFALSDGLLPGQWEEHLLFAVKRLEALEAEKGFEVKPPGPSSKAAPGGEAFFTQDTDVDEETEVAPEQSVDGISGVLLRSGTPHMQGERPSIEDHLGREALVETLADLFSYAEQPPMTMALMGDWGSGKSSLVEQLKQRLPKVGEDKPEDAGKAHYLFAEFNAWEYEQTDSMRAGLAQEVVKGLTGGLDRWQKLVLAVTHASKVHGYEFWFSALTGLIGLIGLIYGVSIATPEHADKLGGQIFGTGLFGGGLFLLLKFWANTKRFLEHPLAEDMKTYLQLPSYGKHLGEVPVIKKELKALCKTRLQKDTDRLLVVVDDLDRCNPQAITDTFDAIRLVMDPEDLSQVAVIIAVDDRIAFRALARHYQNMQVVEPEEGKRRVSRSKEEIARDYLSKIIQLPLRLEPPNERGVREFIVKSLMPAQARKPDAVAVKPKIDMPPAAITEAAQRLIDLEGLDPNLIHGEGLDGEIRKVDVQRYLKSAREHGGEMAEEYLRPRPQASSGELPSEDPSANGATGEVSESLEREQASLSQQQLAQVMTFEPEEQALFAELVAELRLNNPRQLIRLKNSYLVLKRFSYAGQKMSGEAPSGDISLHMGRVEELLTALCWNEYLFQHNAEQRYFDELQVWFWEENPQRMEAMITHFDALQALIRQTPAQVPDIDREPPAHYAGLRFARLALGEQGMRDARQRKREQSRIHANYVRLMKDVEMVILPNAERGLILSIKEAEAVRQVLENRKGARKA